MGKIVRAGVAVAVVVSAAPLVLGVGTAHSAPYYSVSSSIAVTGAPAEVTVDSVTHRAYVPLADAGVVDVIDTTTKTVVGTIAVGSTPVAVALDQSRDRAYVVEYGDRTLAEVDTTTNTVVKRYNVGATPVAAAVDTTTHKVYVTDTADATITVIDPDASVNPAGRISTAYDSVAIIIDSTLHRGYVANSRANLVAVIDLENNLPIYDIPAARFPYKLALDTATHRLYVATNRSDSVSVVDTTTGRVVSTISGIPAPVAISLDPALGVAYVTSNEDGDHKVVVIDTATNAIRATVPTESAAYGIAVDTTTHDVFVPQQDTNEVAVITPGETASQTISFTAAPTAGKVGDTQAIEATGGGSGNPVTFSTTSDACTVTSTGASTASVSYVHAGSCVISADQAGALAYDAAPQQQASAIVARGTQTVRFTSTAPRRAAVGGTYDVTATGTASGQPVLLAIANDASAVCTFSSPPTATGSTTSATVSFTGPGRCTVRALQDGDADHKRSRVAKQGITVKS